MVDEARPETVPAGLDTSTVHPARRYNYWLGGKDHFAVDRASGDLIEKHHPSVRVAVLENRAFLRRAAGFLAGEAGIDQFLDIGTGLPTADNTHEVAQRLRPSARVVYVDNDPMVMTHARALLSGTSQGRTTYLEEDLRDPERILANPELRATLDLGRPVALMLIAVLHFLPDHDEARDIVHHLVGALPPGSWLAATNFTLDYASAETAATAREMIRQGRADAHPRTFAQFADFFTGLELAPPGIVPVHRWRPSDPQAELAADADIGLLGAVGRKPLN